MNPTSRCVLKTTSTRSTAASSGDDAPNAAPQANATDAAQHRIQPHRDLCHIAPRSFPDTSIA